MKVDKKMQDGLWDWMKAINFALLLVIIIRFFVFIPLKVEGDSMSPTLAQGNYLLYETFSEIDRFDIIIFSNEDLSNPYRLIAAYETGQAMARKEVE